MQLHAFAFLFKGLYGAIRYDSLSPTSKRFRDDTKRSSCLSAVTTDVSSRCKGKPSRVSESIINEERLATGSVSRDREKSA